MTDTSKLGSTLARDGSISRPLVAAGGLLDILDRVISQSSIQLTRLLRIASGTFSFNVGRRSRTRQANMPHRTRLPTRTLNTTPTLPLPTLHQKSPKPISLADFYRPPMSVPVKVVPPFQPLVTPLLFKPLAIPASHIPTRSRQLSEPDGSQTSAAAYFQPNQTRGTRSDSSAVNTRRLISWLTGLSSIYGTLPSSYGTLPSSHGRRSSSKPEHGTPDAVPSYQQANHQTFNIAKRLEQALTAVVSIGPRSLTTAGSSTGTGSGAEGPSPGSYTGKGNKSGQGELLLEGSALDRWLTQNLNQAIIRPPTGIIGVDPRITPACVGSSFGP
jgi:hypothetical protein